jgi:hypothetical protein
MHGRVARLRLGLGNVCLKRTSLCLRGTPDLVDVRITVTDVMSQAPSSRMKSGETKLSRNQFLLSASDRSPPFTASVPDRF